MPPSRAVCRSGRRAADPRVDLPWRAASTPSPRTGHESMPTPCARLRDGAPSAARHAPPPVRHRGDPLPRGRASGGGVCVSAAVLGRRVHAAPQRVLSRIRRVAAGARPAPDGATSLSVEPAGPVSARGHVRDGAPCTVARGGDRRAPPGGTHRPTGHPLRGRARRPGLPRLFSDAHSVLERGQAVHDGRVRRAGPRVRSAPGSGGGIAHGEAMERRAPDSGLPRAVPVAPRNLRGEQEWSRPSYLARRTH